VTAPVPVAVVTDSAASLPAELAARHRVTVVPMLLTVGATTYRDGELPLDELLARLDEGVSTSGPTPGDVAAAIEARVEEGHEQVLVLTISRSMSSTYEAASAAARLFEGRARVLDTATAAGGEGLVVLAAAERAEAGAPVEEVEEAARDALSRVRLVATVDNLDRLVASGRVPGIAGWAAGKLGVNPLFEFRAGKALRLRPAFSSQAALDRIVGAWRASAVEGATLHVAALHAAAPARATALLDAVTADTRPATAFVGEFSPVMVAHTGAGLAGLAWWWQSPGRP
jgi:DegV family protein with EDD domain